MAVFRLCSIQNCGKPADALGYCSSHYNRIRRYGDPFAGGRQRPPKGTVQSYIRDVVLHFDDNRCLLWPYARNNEGYAVAKLTGGSSLVSRYVCEFTHGAPPQTSMDAAHSCGNGHLGCVTKAHLSWKSRADNSLDMIEHGTHIRGERHPNAKLTEADVRYIRSKQGKRTCRDLGNELFVHRATIYSVLARKSWAWVI